jgi:chromosome segregation ATPase
LKQIEGILAKLAA